MSTSEQSSQELYHNGTSRSLACVTESLEILCGMLALAKHVPVEKKSKRAFVGISDEDSPLT